MSIRQAAQEWAQLCIDDWANESLGELNEVLGTEFSDDELREVGRLAATALAVLP